MQRGSQHIDERNLGLYLLKAKEVEADLQSIEEHLANCAGCTALFNDLKEYYTQFQELETIAKNSGESLVPIERLMDVRRSSTAIVRKSGLLGKIPSVIRAHPVMSAGGFSALLLVGLILISTTISSRSKLSYVRAKSEYLIAFNETGDEIWRKHIGPGYDLENIYQSSTPEQASSFLTTADVDRDGRQEVLATFGYLVSSFGSPFAKQIVCFNEDGTERWRFSLSRQMIFGNETFTNDYRIHLMAAGDFDRNGTLELFAVAMHVPSYPSAVVQLDPSTGRVMAEYWHSGHISRMAHRDLDGDGVDELLLATENNGFNKSALLVLDPRTIEGHAPSTPEYSPVGVPQGREKYYVLFPRLDLGSLSIYKRNSISSFYFTNDGILQVESAEILPGPTSYAVHFLFNSRMECVNVRGTDLFERKHQDLEREGKLQKKVDESYYRDLGRGLQYWEGEKWSNQATMNKGYMRR